MAKKSLRVLSGYDPHIIGYPNKDKTLYPSGFQAYARIKGLEIPLGIDLNEKTDAIKALGVLESKLDKTGVKATRLKFEDTKNDYLRECAEQLERGEIRVGTFVEKKRILNQLCEESGHKKLLSLNEDWFDDFCASKDQDMMNYRKVLTHFLGWCKRKKYIKVVPQFKIPPHTRRQRKVLKPEHILGLFKALESDEMKLFCSLGLFCGLRPGEATKLKLEHFHEADRAIEITIEHSKTKRPRVIPVNQFVLSLLKSRALKVKSPYFFPNLADPNRHASIGWHRKQWKKALIKAGIVDKDGNPLDYTPHDLRSSSETYSHMLTGFTDTQREKFFGSSTKVQREIYVNFDAEKLRGLENAVNIKSLDKVLEDWGKDGEEEK